MYVYLPPRRLTFGAHRDEQADDAPPAREGQAQGEGGPPEEGQRGEEEPAVEEQCVHAVPLILYMSVGTHPRSRAQKGPGHPEQLPVQGPDPRRGRRAAENRE